MNSLCSGSTLEKGTGSRVLAAKIRVENVCQHNEFVASGVNETHGSKVQMAENVAEGGIDVSRPVCNSHRTFNARASEIRDNLELPLFR